jgi:hypothetical protein
MASGKQRAGFASGGRAVTLAAVLAALSGCATARRVMPPGYLPPSEDGPDLTALRIEITELAVAGLGPEDWSARPLRSAFADRLRATARFGQVVQLGGDAAPEVLREDLVPVQVAVQLQLEESRSFTGLFDALMFYPIPAVFPFMPHWGDASVDAQLIVRLPGEAKTAEPIKVAITAPWSMLFYSWYRTGPIEEAFRRATTVVFDELALRLTRHLVREKTRGLMGAITEREERLAVRLVVESLVAADIEKIASSTCAALVLAPPLVEEPAPPPLEATAPARNAEIPSDVEIAARALAAAGYSPYGIPTRVYLPPDDFAVIARPIRGARNDFLGRYLGALGGVEVARFRGFAGVESRANTVNGPEELVGSGRASNDGYRVSLYRPPDRTGFFFPPAFGALSQEITIAGFQDDIPLFSLQTGRGDIPAIASDPATGAAVDLNEPITYALDMQSVFIGQGVGLNLVLGTEVIQFFGTAILSVNLLELRHMNVRIWESDVEGTKLVAFRSAAAAAQAGVAIPDLHLALRVALQYDWYFDFDYPQPVEFRARTAYNPQKDVFERQRAFVNGASLTAGNWQVSAIFLF